MRGEKVFTMSGLPSALSSSKQSSYTYHWQVSVSPHIPLYSWGCNHEKGIHEVDLFGHLPGHLPT